jgi:hypothetical protein
VDGQLALLLTDPMGLFDKGKYVRHQNDSQHLSNLAFLTENEEEIRMKLADDRRQWSAHRGFQAEMMFATSK